MASNRLLPYQSYQPYTPYSTGGPGYFNNNKPGGGLPDWALPLAGGLLSLGGSALEARSKNKAAQAQQDQSDVINKLLSQFIAGQGAPNPYETQLTGRAANPFSLDFAMPDLPNVYRDLGVATDPILQSLRAGSPNASALSGNLLDLLNTGDPFDTSIISASLDPLRQRNTARAMATLQAGAPGLGQRFGTAQRASAQELQRQALEDAAAQDSQLLFAGHESAQARRLQAAGQLNAQDQNDIARQNAVLSALIGQANVGLGQGRNQIDLSNLGLESQRLALAGQTEQDQILQTLLGNKNAQNQQILQALGIMGGVPVGAAPGYGSVAGDAGQLLLLYSLLGKK